MGNIQKFIMFCVGLLITIGIIYVGMSFYSKSQTVSKAADSGLSDIQNNVSASKYSAYNNGNIVTGSQAIDAIRNYASSSFTVVVITKSKESVSYTSSNGYATTDINSSKYIDPAGNFKCTLGHTDNGTINKIELLQQ